MCPARSSRSQIEWTIGEAAGLLAAYCLENRTTPHQVRAQDDHLERFQQSLAHQGVELSWPNVHSY